VSFLRGAYNSGARGPAGAPGADGSAGPGFYYLGVWDALSSYNVDDVVSWDGSSFICVAPTTGDEPPNDTYWGVLAAAGVDGGDNVPVAVELDDAGGGVTYVGKADPGTATSASGWQIQRITETGADISIEWADGDALYNNVWDDRLSLSYS